MMDIYSSGCGIDFVVRSGNKNNSISRADMEFNKRLKCWLTRLYKIINSLIENWKTRMTG